MARVGGPHAGQEDWIGLADTLGLDAGVIVGSTCRYWRLDLGIGFGDERKQKVYPIVNFGLSHSNILASQILQLNYISQYKH